MYQGKFANSAPQTRPAKPQKGMVLFLCIYGVLVVAVLIAFCCLMTPLRQWLVAYEAAQLENKSAQVFEELFDDPDWKMLYELSGRADTLYEGADAYTAYMEDKVGSVELTCHETDTGLPGVHKYHICLGEEKVAAFTMTGDAGSLTENPQWTLDTVELFFERTVGVTVEKKPGYTVYINGVALDDSFTVRTTATRAEEYLPEGIHGYRLEQQYIDGLLTQPEVLVLDERGEAVEVTLNPETGIYTLQLPAAGEMTEEERTLARNAAIADAKFSMRSITTAQLRKYFDADSQVYADILHDSVFIQSHKSSSVDESSIEVGEYYRYSDELFSANVKLSVNVIRKDDTVKVYALDKTYFFTRNDSGNYLVSEYTNEPVQETVEQVRLTFVTNEEEQVSFMVNCEADTVTLPEITVPEGEELVGWATRTDDGNGTVPMTVRLMPTGVVLGELEPMTLYPVFQTVQGETAGEV